MKERQSNYDINNSMEAKSQESEQEEEEESLELTDQHDKDKLMQEVNNTMLLKNKEKQLKKIKQNEIKNKKNKKKENKINNILDEIDNEIEENNILDIQNIFEINTKFNYSRDLPVFYLKNDNNNEDMFKEPLSTNTIKDLLKNKKIKPYLTNIKLIDIFYMKNYSPFAFFPLNDILVKNWSNNLEYSIIFINAHNKLKEKEKKEIKDKEKKENKDKENKNKIEILPKKQIKKISKISDEPKNKKIEDESLNFNFSVIKQGGFNDLSMSIIKQLEGISLTKKQVDKITSIIEEVEEDEWTEVKNKKNKEEIEEKNDIGIVGLNDNKKGQTKNKKNLQQKKKKNNFKDNNQFNGLKINYYD